MHWFALLLVLCLFWGGLSFELSNPILVASGLLTAGLVTYVVYRKQLLLSEWGLFRVLRACVVYLPWLSWQILLANLRVMQIVWKPSLPIDPQLVEVPTQLNTGIGRVVFANSITLTPGTVSVEIGPDRVLVHALTEGDSAGVLDQSMHRRVKALEPGT